MTRVQLQRLTSRQGFLWLGGTLLAIALVTGWAVVTAGASPWWLLLVPGLALLLVLTTLRHAQWLELGGDEPVLVQRRTATTRRVPLRSARDVRLGTNGAGTLLLHATARDGGRAFAPLLLLSPYVQRSQPPEVLEAVRGALGGSRATGADAVRAQLAAQLAHLRRGGDAPSSPLAPLARDLAGAAGAAGAAGGVAGQL